MSEPRKPAPQIVQPEMPDLGKFVADYKKQLGVTGGIPVKLARFLRPLQIPGSSSSESASTNKQPNGCAAQVEFIPQMRHHMIAYLNPNERVVKIGFVPEGQVLTWEPLLL